MGLAVILLLIPSVCGRKTMLEQADGVVTARSYGELTATIDTVLAGKGYSRAGTMPLSDFLGPLDGKSSSRLLDAVAGLVHCPRACAHRAQERESQSDAIH